jgi:hypothetical protein
MALTADGKLLLAVNNAEIRHMASQRSSQQTWV